MRKIIQSVSLLLALLLSLGVFVGCSSTPSATDDATTPSAYEPADSEESEVFAICRLVSDLTLGMKNTASLAVIQAAAVLDRCEATAVSAQTISVVAKKYYENNGSEFRVMFDEKIRLVAEACAALRDEATREQTLSDAQATSKTTWTDKAFSTADALFDGLKE